MPRTVSEVDAEIAELRASGMDGRNIEVKTLVKEREALIATLPAVPVTSVSLPARVSVEADVADLPHVEAPVPSEAKPDPFQSDEWAFIEKALAEIEITPGTGVVKKIFNEVDSKVKSWRLMREIVTQVGIGNEWPQWSALGRNEYTGRKEEAKAKPAAAAPPPAAEKPIPPPAAVPAFAPREDGPSDLDKLKMAVQNMTSAALDNRAPPRKPEAVAV